MRKSLHEIIKNNSANYDEEALFAKGIEHIINTRKINYAWPKKFTELKQSLFYYGIDLTKHPDSTHTDEDYSFLKQLGWQIQELLPQIEKIEIKENKIELQNRLKLTIKLKLKECQEDQSITLNAKLKQCPDRFEVEHEHD